MGQFKRNASTAYAFAATILVVLVLVTVGRSETVLDLVNEVSQTNYTTYLTTLLYTHDGNNRAFDYSANPRHPTTDHDAARDNIRSFFTGLGLMTQLDPFEFIDDGATFTGCSNVVAVHPGRVRPNHIYVLGAHYDSMNNPGADDDASGIAAIMEAARILSRRAFEATVVFIAFDAEEMGMTGSRHYVADHLTDHIRGMVAIDMIANNQGNANIIYGRQGISNSVMNALQNAFSEFAPSLSITQIDQWDIGDHAPFELNGFPACGLSESMPFTNPNWHQLTDSVDLAGYLDYSYATGNVRAVVGYAATAATLTSIPIQGTVTLDNFTGDKTAVPITITINATPPETHAVNLNAAGHYSFSTTLCGIHNLTAKASHWLQKMADNITLGGAVPADFTLTNGDCDNNNAVNATDLAILLAAMDTTPPSDPRTDLDGNGTVDSTDMAILLNAMDHSGE